MLVGVTKCGCCCQVLVGVTKCGCMLLPGVGRCYSSQVLPGGGTTKALVQWV